MKKIFLIIICLLCSFSAVAVSQDQLLSLRRDFISAGIDVKLVILRSTLESDDEGLIPLYKEFLFNIKKRYPLAEYRNNCSQQAWRIR